jgi:pimeloyl-ACP methyl ester carboxylesterase
MYLGFLEMSAVPTAAVNGIRIAYESHGNTASPALVLIRGTGSQLVHWPRALIDGLVGMGLRVIAFDNRDCGQSTNFEDRPTPSMSAVFAALASGEPLSPVYRLEDMALDLVGLLDTLRIQSAHLLGLSLGGYVGQIVAADHPQRVRSFIQVMSSAAVPTPQKMHSRVMAAMTTPPRGADVPALEDHALHIAQACTGSGYPIDEKWFRETFRLAHSRGMWPGCTNRHVLAMMATGDRMGHCGRIQMPALVVHGTEDPMVPFDEGRTAASAIPGAEFVPIEGLGHEFTPRFARTLLPVLDSFITRATAAKMVN